MRVRRLERPVRGCCTMNGSRQGKSVLWYIENMDVVVRRLGRGQVVSECWPRYGCRKMEGRYDAKHGVLYHDVLCKRTRGINFLQEAKHQWSNKTFHSTNACSYCGIKTLPSWDRSARLEEG